MVDHPIDGRMITGLKKVRDLLKFQVEILHQSCAWSDIAGEPY